MTRTGIYILGTKKAELSNDYLLRQLGHLRCRKPVAFRAHLTVGLALSADIMIIILNQESTLSS
jgi:hypothetical protein